MTRTRILMACIVQLAWFGNGAVAQQADQAKSTAATLVLECSAHTINGSPAYRREHSIEIRHGLWQHHRTGTNPDGIRLVEDVTLAFEKDGRVIYQAKGTSRRPYRLRLKGNWIATSDRVELVGGQFSETGESRRSCKASVVATEGQGFRQLFASEQVASSTAAEPKQAPATQALKSADIESSKPPIGTQPDYATLYPAYRVFSDGDARDLLLLFNANGSAPNLDKDLQGSLRFADGRAVVCLSTSSLGKENAFFLDTRLRALGATKITWGKDCSPERFNAINDVHILERDSFAKMPNEKKRQFLAQLQSAKMSDILTLRYSEFLAEAAGRNAARRQVEKEVVASERTGYGFLGLPSGAPKVCATPLADQASHQHLVSWHQESLDQFVLGRTSYDISFMTADEAFAKTRRKGCRFVYGPADDLKLVAVALKRDGFEYSFVDTWSTTQDFEAAKKNVLDNQEKRSLEENSERQKRENDHRLRMEREAAEGQARRRATEALRKQSEVRVKTATTQFETEVDALLKGQSNSSIDQLYPAFTAWFAKRRAESWEFHTRSIEVYDFGRSDWNDRRLETIYLRLTLTLKNRPIGSYAQSCWVFSRVDDSEFAMYRGPFVTSCDGAETRILLRQQQIGFQSEWNAR